MTQYAAQIGADICQNLQHLVRGGSLGGVALEEARDEVLGGLADAQPRRAGQVHRRPQDHLVGEDSPHADIDRCHVTHNVPQQLLVRGW